MLEIERGIGLIKKYFFGQKDVICVYLFGSFAKDKQNCYSDLDIAILLDTKVEKKEYTNRQIVIMSELSCVLNLEVDVIILNKASIFLRFQALRYGKRIYEKKDRENRLFEARVILDYFDFSPVRSLLESGIIRKIKEA